jgi:hypothetical protein
MLTITRHEGKMQIKTILRAGGVAWVIEHQPSMKPWVQTPALYKKKKTVIDITSYPLGWLKQKRWTIASVSDVVEKLETIVTLGNTLVVLANVKQNYHMISHSEV